MAVLFTAAPAHAAPEQTIYRDVPASTRAALVREWGSDDCRPMAADVLQTTDLNKDGRLDYRWSSNAIECSGAGFAPSTIWISGLDGGFRKFDTYGWQFIEGPMGSAVLTNACGDDTLSAFEARQNASVLGWDNRTDDFIELSGCLPTAKAVLWAVEHGFAGSRDFQANEMQEEEDRQETETLLIEDDPSSPEFQTFALLVMEKYAGRSLNPSQAGAAAELGVLNFVRVVGSYAFAQADHAASIATSANYRPECVPGEMECTGPVFVMLQMIDGRWEVTDFTNQESSFYKRWAPIVPSQLLPDTLTR